jgi:hypothetical protein
VSGIEDAKAQTSISLQEGPLEEFGDIPLKNLTRSSGLRSGKLGRIVPEAWPVCRTIALLSFRSVGYS